MKITINLTSEEVEHIYPEHDFYDCCSEVEQIMIKVQKEIEKERKGE